MLHKEIIISIVILADDECLYVYHHKARGRTFSLPGQNSPCKKEYFFNLKVNDKSKGEAVS